MFKFLASMFAALHNLGVMAEMYTASMRGVATQDFLKSTRQTEDGQPFDAAEFNEAHEILKQMRK